MYDMMRRFHSVQVEQQMSHLLLKTFDLLLLFHVTIAEMLFWNLIENVSESPGLHWLCKVISKSIQALVEVGLEGRIY